MTLIQLKYGLGYVVAGATLTVGIWNGVQWYITQGDTVEILQGGIERSLATSLDTGSTYQVNPIAYVETWTENGTNYLVTNAVGWYVSKALFSNIAVNARTLVPYYLDTNTYGTLTVTGLWDKLNIGDGTNRYGFETSGTWYVKQSDMLEVYKVLHELGHAILALNTINMTTTVVTAHGYCTWGCGVSLVGAYTGITVYASPEPDWPALIGYATECMEGTRANGDSGYTFPTMEVTIPGVGEHTNFTVAEITTWGGSVTTSTIVNASVSNGATVSAYLENIRQTAYDYTYTKIGTDSKVYLDYSWSVNTGAIYDVGWPATLTQALVVASTGNFNQTIAWFASVDGVDYGPDYTPPSGTSTVFSGLVRTNWWGTLGDGTFTIDIPSGVDTPISYPWGAGAEGVEYWGLVTTTSRWQALSWVPMKMGDPWKLSTNVFSYCTNEVVP